MPAGSLSQILFLLFILVNFLTTACSYQNEEKKLPILGNRMLIEENSGNADTIYHTIADFKFVDQDSNTVTNKTFEGKVYVADFFFTSCPTICPVMKSQMLRVYEKFNNNDEVMILSHTIDPEHDTIPLLKSYAERLGVSAPKWRFVTGTQDELYDIGQGSYMVATAEDKLEPGGFIHSGAFILVDKNRMVRGIYDGTKEDQVDQLINDIPVLLQEYQNN
jgi:protein SCO1